MNRTLGICRETKEIAKDGALLTLACDRPLGSAGRVHTQHHTKVIAADGSVLDVWWREESP